MDKKVVLLLTVLALVLGCALLVTGQQGLGFYPDQHIGGYPDHHGGGGGRYCQCRRYCFRGERYSGPCRRRRPWRHFGGGGWGRRRVLCCPMYGPWY